MNDEIAALAEQVRILQEKQKPVERDAAFREMERQLSAAKLDREIMERQRDEAVRDLEKLRHDVAWTMDTLKIRDIMTMRGSIDVPCSDEGWLPLDYDPQDTKRIEYLNKHGRASIGQLHWLFAFDHKITDFDEAELPKVYNCRHMIDLAMNASKALAKGQSDE